MTTEGRNFAEVEPDLEPLNGRFEVGLRALAILSSAFPRSLDIDSLTFLEYSVLYSEDFGGPESLHPDVPNHRSELALKRELLEQGLEVMIRARLIALQINRDGIQYVATDNAPGFVDLLESGYMGQLRERAQWALRFFAEEREGPVHSDLAGLLRSVSQEMTRASGKWQRRES